MQILFFLIPTVLISRIIGILVSIPAPHALWQLVIRWFCRQYRVDTSEAALPLSEYKNLADFFVRDLKQGLRPVGAGLVAPVDGTLRNSGIIRSEHLPQIKGRYYRLRDLLHDEALERYYQGGHYLNLYLSPRDYHHIHAPIDGYIERVSYAPGRLLPVNDLSMSTINNVFGVNERVSIVIRTPDDHLVTVTMVGALNVGKMILTFDGALTQRIKHSLFGGSPFNYRYQNKEMAVSKGARIGTFELGSSVVVLTPRAYLSLNSETTEPHSVRYGESIEPRLRT